MHDKILKLAREVLGEYVSYARVDDIGQERTGNGHVCSVHLDERMRPVVRVVDGGKSLNIDAQAINLTDEERVHYFEVAKQIRARADKINHDLNSQVKEREKELDVMRDTILGAPVVLAPVPEEEQKHEVDGEIAA